MPLYRISLVQTVYESADVYIEADSKQEAEELALRQAEDHSTAADVEWKFLEALGDIEVIKASEVPPRAADDKIQEFINSGR